MRSSGDGSLSIIVLAWNQLPYTRRCVEAIRKNTSPPYELVLVDNGSEPEARAFAAEAADTAVLLDQNLGFAKGMNAGLSAATGEFVAFVNNDTLPPPQWADPLIETVRRAGIGMAVPAVTAAGNLRTVRQNVRDTVTLLHPFESPPSGVVCVLRTAVAREIGGWGEEFSIASGEDADLAFKLWVNDFDIAFDERVLVLHESKVTARLLPDWRRLWRSNGQQFFAKWSDLACDVPRVASCDRERFLRNRRAAAAAAEHMSQFRQAQEERHRVRRTLRPLAPYLDAVARRRQRRR